MRFCFVGFSFVFDILQFACVLVKEPRDIGYFGVNIEALFIFSRKTHFCSVCRTHANV